MSKTSIIIPTYNRINYLIEAVESCLNQTNNNIEVLIIDDGSIDSTEKIITRKIKENWKDYDIFYFKQKNAGASAARNKGLELAKGEYIQFLDSDDLLHPNKIELQEQYLNEDTDTVGCSCFGLIGKSFDNKDTQQIGICCDSPDEYIQQLTGRTVHGMQTSAPLWRSSFIKSQQGWRTDISLGDDLEYHIRLLCNAKNIGFVNKPLFLVREHEGERLSVVNQDKQKIQSSILTKQIIYQTLLEHGKWRPSVQKAFLGSFKTSYANALAFYNPKEIKEFEKWIWPLATKPTFTLFFPLIIFIRCTLGAKTITKIHQLLIHN